MGCRSSGRPKFSVLKWLNSKRNRCHLLAPSLPYRSQINNHNWWPGFTRCAKSYVIWLQAQALYLPLYPTCPWFQRWVWSSTLKSPKENHLHFYHVPMMNFDYTIWLPMICSLYPLLNMIHYSNTKKQLKINFSSQCECLKPAKINLYYFVCFLPKKTADLSSFWNVCRFFCKFSAGL